MFAKFNSCSLVLGCNKYIPRYVLPASGMGFECKFAVLGWFTLADNMN